MNTINIVFHSDPSHGWGQVPHNLIADLGIGSKISRYSYQDQENAYLEEDCDLGIFIRACESRDIPISFSDFPTNSDSPIRNKKRFEWGF